jgi:hypothetical protein
MPWLQTFSTYRRVYRIRFCSTIYFIKVQGVAAAAQAAFDAHQPAQLGAIKPSMKRLFMRRRMPMQRHELWASAAALPG